jgi:hypothetical protein
MCQSDIVGPTQLIIFILLLQFLRVPVRIKRQWVSTHPSLATDFERYAVGACKERVKRGCCR